MNLTHVRLLVDDYAACFRFYRDVLDLTPTFGDEASGYADFDTGDVSLALFDRAEMLGALGGSPGDPAGDSTGDTAPPDRVALVVGVDDVDAAVERLQAADVAVETAPTDRPDWGIRVAHCRDPDGTLLEVNSPLG